MRTTKTNLLFVFALGIAVSCALWGIRAEADSHSPITYHNGSALDSNVATVATAVNTNSALDGFDPSANALVRTIVVQPDGKLLIGGDFTALAPNGGASVARNFLARLNADGTVDAGFNPNPNGSIQAIALQSDGKIVLAGDFNLLTPSGGASINRIFLARLNTDGTIDNTFDPRANNSVFALAVQADGGIIVGGNFTGLNPGGGPTVTRNRIARLNPDGTVDAIFNPNANTTVNALAVQADGRILAGGNFTSLAPNGGATVTRNYVARLNFDGSLDASFDPNPDSILGSMALQSDGKILIGGAFTALTPNGGALITRNYLARLNADGTVDAAFNPNPNGFVRCITLQTDGRILIGGGFITVGGPFVFHKYIARVNADGTVDAALNPAPNDQVFAIAQQPDGKIVLGGPFYSANSILGQTRNRIARLEKDGRLDQTLNFNMVGSDVIATAVQPDGKILIGGDFNSVLGVARNNIARLNTDGTLDTTFNPNANSSVASLVVQADGKIVVGGSFTAFAPNSGTSITRNNIARLNADGTVDTAFDPNANDWVNPVALQADGKILIGGSFTALAPNGGPSVTRGFIARLNTDGTVDTTFTSGPNAQVYAIAVQPDGKILVGGQFSDGGSAVARNYIARLNPDGTFDAAFNPNADNTVLTIAVQSDGKILVGGTFNMFAPNGGASVTRNRIARLNVDGSIDSTFDPSANGSVNALVIQADGKILIGGSFTTISPNGGASQTRNRFARLNADGTVDAFDPGASNVVLAIALQADGKILVGGSFDGIAGQARSGFARLANDTAAIQNLAVTPTSVTWTRSGAAPELSRVTFERSTDGVNYTFLGNGTRVGTSSDFTLAGQALPIQQNLNIRARGVYRGGVQTASESITEFARNVFIPPFLHLAFSQQPANAPAGIAINPAVTVQILDASNNLVNSISAVTVAIGNNPASGILSGTRTVAAVGGTATFNNLSIDKVGAGYTLAASGTNLAGAVSSPFNITAGAASSIVATAGSGQSATINSTFANALQATVTDASGTPVSGVTVNFAAPASGASGTFANNTTSTPATTNASGVATASTFTANGTAGLYNVIASINAGSPSTAFSLTNAAANQTITVTTHAPSSAVYNTQFSVAAVSSSGLPVSYSSSGSCTNNGATFTMTAGTSNCTVKYDQPGDVNHGAAPQVTETVTAQKASQTITFDALPAKTFGDSDFAVNASATSGLNVSFAALGNCGLSGTTVHITGAGSCTITASQPGSSGYNAAPDVARSFNIAKGGQTISFGTLSNKTFGDGDFAVSASASSGLAVSFAASGQCAMSGSMVHLNGAGSCAITASQPGDANYNAAADVQRSFQISKGSQTITFESLSNKTFGDADFVVSASASSGLAVSFAVSGSCSISGSNVHINGAGSCTITASQGGDSNRDAAADVARSFQIAKASTTTGLSYSANPSGQDGTFTATVTSGAGIPSGTVTFKDNGAAIASCSDVALNSGSATCVTALSNGNHTFTANYSGEANFDASQGTYNGGPSSGGGFEFSQANYVAAERGGSVTITVKRTGDVTAAASVDYATEDGSIPSVAIPCSVVTGVALERCDYTRAAGTLRFASNETEKSFVVLVNDDSHVEGSETISLKLSNPSSGLSLGIGATATLQILDDVVESSGNVIDDEAAFVREHYHDLLNREPDPDGLKFWTQNMTSCESNVPCAERKRVDTSAAFFLSIEFQETGYLVERFYKTAYGDATGASTFTGPHQLSVPIIRWREFLRDTQEIGRDVVVGQGAWQQQLEDHKQAFAREFISRQRFTDAYPASMSAEQFINQLNANAGNVLNKGDMVQLEAVFGGPNVSSADADKRAQVLRSVAEDQTLERREFNRAFVLMQYFGYLRRNPDDAQDTDYTGYDFWLRKLEQFDGNYINAEMVKAFISSIEYRQRFGQ